MVTKKHHSIKLGIMIVFIFSAKTLAQDAEIVDLSLGNRWIYSCHYHAYAQYGDYDVSGNYSRVKEIIGDTVINNKDYTIVSITSIYDTIVTYEEEFWRLDSNKFYILGESNDVLIYDTHIYQDTTWGWRLIGGFVDVSFENWWDIYCFAQTWASYWYATGPDRHSEIKTVNIFGPVKKYLYNEVWNDPFIEERYWDNIVGINIRGICYGAPAPPLDPEVIPGISQVTFSWDANIESDIIYYRIYFGTSASELDMIDSTDSARDTMKVICNLENDITYYFRVAAVDSALNESELSLLVWAVPTSPTSVLDSLSHTNSCNPLTFVLFQNYPNPFNSMTSIEYSLPEALHVRIEVYNTLGQVVDVLIDEGQDAGYHAVTWDGSDLSSGVYFYRITAEKFSACRCMVLLK